MANAVVFNALDAQAVATVGVSAASIGTNPSVVGGIRGVRLQADPGNTANIYLGSTSGVTAVPALAWGVLRPGEWLFVPLNSIAEIFAISAVAAQKLLVGAAS
jgi:hypothetical protein